MKLLKLISACAALTLLAGCAANINTIIEDDALDADEASLGNDYSVPMQMMYLYTQEKPVKENNLDKYNFNADYSRANNILVGASIATSVAGGASALSTLFSASSIAVNDKMLNPEYTLNRIIYFEPVKGNMQETRTRAQAKVTEILNNAYINAGFDTTVIPNHFDNSDGGKFLAFDIRMARAGNAIRPLQNPDCPYELRENGFEYKTILSPDICQASAPAYGHLIKNNEGQIPFAPKGDFIMFSQWLPSNFPINSISTNDTNAYVYQPSMIWLRKYSLWLKDVPEERLVSMYKNGQLTYNPYIKKLSTGEFMYFNSEVSGRQKSPTSRAMEIKISK